MAGFLEIFYLAWVLIFIATHISLSVVVFRDALARDRTALCITPLLWTGITLSLPVIGMFIYWIMNYSILIQDKEKSRAFDVFGKN